MPSYVRGFEVYAQAHPEVGDPLTSEFIETAYNTERGMFQVIKQFTTEGVLRYFAESNEIHFFPFDSGE